MPKPMPEPPSPEPSPLDVKRAWRLARAHCHHWAQDRLLLPLAKRLVDAGAGGLSWWENSGALEKIIERSELSCDRGCAAEPPRTTDEARLLGLLPSQMRESAQRYEPDELGIVTHITRTGRTMWCVYPHGWVDLNITRPGEPDGGSPVIVLSATMTAQGEVSLQQEGLAAAGLGIAACERHWDALAVCLDALGAWVPKRWQPLRSTANHEETA